MYVHTHVEYDILVYIVWNFLKNYKNILPYIYIYPWSIYKVFFFWKFIELCNSHHNLFKNIFITSTWNLQKSPSFWNILLLHIRFWCCFFSLSPLNMLFLCFCFHWFWWQVSLLGVVLNVMGHFSFVAFKIFSLSLSLSIFTIICLGMDLFVIILLWVC